MTYCVALKLRDGLVLCSDSRTNAGVLIVAASFSARRILAGTRTSVYDGLSGEVLTEGGLAVREALQHDVKGHRR